MQLAPRQHGMFDGTFLQMIQNLIAGDGPLASNLPGLHEIRHIEVAYAIGKYLALIAQRFERRK
jgi:hypothetical protein